MASRPGNFRFTVRQNGKSYVVLVNKTVHNTLLRRNLLRKLGYFVPPTAYRSQLRIQFSSVLEKEMFFDELAKGTFGDPARWIPDHHFHVAEKKKAEGEEAKPGPLAEQSWVLLQDAVVLEDQSHLYNLALGYVPTEVIQGRRVLNALLLPFALTYVPESVNLFSWSPGRVLNKQLKFPYDSAEEFTPTFDDGKWMARRILRLQREDFVEIVEHAHYPKAVAALLVEKLIARRNQMRELFGLISTVLPFEANLNVGDEVKDGKLLKQNYPGYASRFAYGDPESPFSRSEITAFLGSRVIGTGLRNIVSFINDRIPHTDLNAEILQRQKDLFDKQLQHFFRTGEVRKVPMGVWVYPIWGVNLIASRDIVTGSYLGTDNVVQIADTLGASALAGAYINLEGIAAPFPAAVGARAQGSITRTYTHLRPVKSFKAAVKYSFKNLMVPLLKRKIGHLLDELANGKAAGETTEEKQEALKKIVTSFKEHLPVGDSLIISDSLGGGLSVNGAMSYAKVLKAQAEFGASQVVISRLHIHRKDENTIQIYKDLGNIRSLILSFQMKAVAPVLSLSARWSKGDARIRFYTLDINPRDEDPSALASRLQALRHLLLRNSLALVKNLQKPLEVKHAFHEKFRKARILWWQKTSMGAASHITVQHPEGFVRKFLRSQEGRRKGVNYEQFTVDAIRGVISDYSEWDAQISSATSGNPGDSMGGSSFVLRVTLDSALNEQGGLEQPFVAIAEDWRGWSIKRKKALQLLASLEERFGTEILPELELGQVEKILLYNLAMQLYLYPRGVEHFINMGLPSVERLWKAHATGKVKTFKRLRFIKMLKKAKRSRARGEKYAKYVRKALSMAYRWLDFTGFKQAVGGDDHFLLSARLRGFRDGDENGDQTLISHTVGQVGGRQTRGPLFDLMHKSSMIEGEFFGYWIMAAYTRSPYPLRSKRHANLPLSPCNNPCACCRRQRGPGRTTYGASPGARRQADESSRDYRATAAAAGQPRPDGAC